MVGAGRLDARMGDFREGDYVRHTLDPELLLAVVRVQTDSFGGAVLVVRDASGTFDPRHTFKVEGHQVRKVPA